MAKTLNEAPISTRNARGKLASGLYWRGIDPEVHLGYRKGKRGGVWLVRWRNGAGYRQERIGVADDELSEGTLDFNAAVRTAREHVEATRIETRASAAGPIQTVRLAIEAYITRRDARDSARKGSAVRSDAAVRLVRYIIGREGNGRRPTIMPALIANIALHELDDEQLRGWRISLEPSLKRSSQQRLTNDLKAALNAAYATHRKKLPQALPTIIKQGLAIEKDDGDDAIDVDRANQILPDETISKILAAALTIDETDGWEGDLYRLLIVLAGTGARFSQVTRMRVADLQTPLGRMMVPTSRKGKKSKKRPISVPVGEDVIDALAPETFRRAPEEYLLMRWRHKQVSGSIRWERTERGPWNTPSEIVRPWAKIREIVGLADNIVPYALRHSSIVRGIGAGLPISLVANLHDTSVAMIEGHYARWITDGLDELAAQAIVPLLPKK